MTRSTPEITNPMVGIMMIAFNAESTIRLSITSLVNQTYTNWKCVLINDGSTDDTEKIILEFNDPRINYVKHQQNYGRPAARQTALGEMDRIDYLAFLDADDFYHPEKLEIQVEFLRRNQEVKLVTSAMYLCGANGLPLAIQGPLGDINISGFQSSISHGPSMLRMPLPEGAAYDERFKLGQDIEFLKQILNSGKIASILYKPLYFYQIAKSLTLKKYIFNHCSTDERT